MFDKKSFVLSIISLLVISCYSYDSYFDYGNVTDEIQQFLKGGNDILSLEDYDYKNPIFQSAELAEMDAEEMEE